jgi:hypothetical protein
MVKVRVKIFFSLLQLLTPVLLPVAVQAQSPTEMKQIFSQAESYYLYGEYELPILCTFFLTHLTFRMLNIRLVYVT